MKITKLSLTNFRSFKETQTIEFAPTTLLFGPNSAGKSTILMAFFYIQHILEKGNCDPQYTMSMMPKEYEIPLNSLFAQLQAMCLAH